jgi:hypothetical protein
MPLTDPFDNTAPVAALVPGLQKARTRSSINLINMMNAGGPLAGGNVIGGVTVANGDVVLLTGQSFPSQNGPWVADATLPYRPSFADTGAKVLAMVVEVTEGASANKRYQCTTAGPITLGTTGLTFTSEIAAPATVALATGFDNTPPDVETLTANLSNGFDNTAPVAETIPTKRSNSWDNTPPAVR